MNANKLLLDNILDINPRTGTIEMHEKRMVLMSTNALGILRSDLITTLGHERSKGFLLRYGWSCGYKAGESMIKEYNWESPKELLLAGAVMHTLEGVVTAEPNLVEVEGDKLYYSGYWRNSFESAEYLDKYGTSKEPVCWTLLGYASGYLTKVFGHEIIVHEKYCRAMGDTDCYFVAQTVAHAKEECLKDLRYYKTESLQTVIDDMYKEMEQLNEDILASEKVQNELTELFLEDRDINEIITQIGIILGRSIVINHFYEVYSSYFKCNEDQIIYDKWKLDGGIAKERDNLFFESFSIKSQKVGLGRMIVIGNQQLNKAELLIINRAKMVLTIQMFHQQKFLKSIWKKREEFFGDIIANKVIDDSLLKRQALIFGFNLDEKIRIVALNTSMEETKEELLNFLSKRDSSQDIFMKDGYIVMIVSESKEQDIERFTTLMLDEIHGNFPDVKVSVGSGQVVNKIQMLSKSYQDAIRICDFVRLTYPMGNRQADFKELEPIMMFLKGTDQEELINFYSETIGELVEYDVENQGNLLITLKSYLDNNGNLQQTADELHLSVAGLRYRIDRIESLSGLDLKTGSGRFKSQLATRIYFVLQVMNK